jgi:AraC-like DNA-binding protein
MPSRSVRNKATSSHQEQSARVIPAENTFQWTTQNLGPNHRLDAYVGTLCERLMNVTVSKAQRDGFYSTVVMAPLGEVMIGAIGGSKHRSARTTLDIAKSRDQAFNLIVGINGVSKWTDSKNQLVLRPGDMILGDSRLEHFGDFPEGYMNMNVRMPIEWLRTWVPEPRTLVGRRIDRESRWGSLLSQFVAKLTPWSGDRLPLPLHVVSDQIGALLALAASEVPGVSMPDAVSAPDHYLRIKDCIRQRCGELQLRAADIALSVQLSPRTLHRILASHGETFGRLLIDARLDVAQRMLESKFFRRLSTAEIGRRAGFSETSHFYRVFRQHLNATPGQFRSLVGVPQSDAEIGR